MIYQYVISIIHIGMYSTKRYLTPIGIYLYIYNIIYSNYL